MKVVFGIFFISTSVFAIAQNNWEQLQKAEDLLNEGKTFNVPYLLKRSAKLKGPVCGNAASQLDLENKRLWAKYYSVKGDTDRALSNLLPFVFNNGLAPSDSLALFTYYILLDKYGKDKLRALFLESLDEFSKSAAKKEMQRNQYQIKFLDQVLTYYDWTLKPKTNIAEEIRQDIEAQYFSQLILIDLR